MNTEQSFLNPLYTCRLCGQEVRDSHLREHFLSMHRDVWLSTFQKMEVKSQ